MKIKRGDTVKVIAGDDKPVKLVIEGDSRTKTESYDQTNDMTETYKVMTKVGFGLVFSDKFGVFTWM